MRDVIIELFGGSTKHPLTDARELKRAISELPADDAYRALDEVAGWFDSLRHATEIRPDRLFEALSALDVAAQPSVRRLTREYLAAVKQHRSEARRLWQVGQLYWQELTQLYERLLQAAQENEKHAELLKATLPLITCRLLAAYGSELKWSCFQHERPPAELWQRAGRAYLFAEENKLSGKVMKLYPLQAGVTTAGQEFLRAVMLGVAALDTLQPVEIELAERLIGDFLSHFIVARGDTPGMLFWIDAAEPGPPLRLAKLPKASPSLRLVSPGGAPKAIEAVIHQVERGEVPATLNLGGQYPSRQLLKVLRHLASYWSPKPPMREHKRHAVRSQLAVVHGYEACLNVLDRGVEETSESWWIDNVSLGGFGAVVDKPDERWLRVGALLCMRPEGGGNWLLGLVRRYAREGGKAADVGIQTLSREVKAADFVPRTSGTYMAAAGFRGLILIDGDIDTEVRVLLPANTFDLRESLDAKFDGQRMLLAPAECLDSGAGFDLARYRVRPAE